MLQRKSSHHKKEENKRHFLQIASKLQSLESSVNMIACSETLCWARPVIELIQSVPTICKHHLLMNTVIGHVLSIGHSL